MAVRKDNTPHGTPVETGAAPLDADRLTALRSLVPEAFSETGIDFDKLKLSLGGTVDEGKERYGLSWSGKAQSVRQLMLPSRATLVPDPKESVNFDTTQHVFIEGENLEVLKLLRKAYAGRVKMIYIDPPYNTGKDFIYPDNFADPLGDYLKKTGQVDEDGNWTSSVSDTDGRKHSKWLSMIYPRLLAARDLLRDDGVIFVSIDDHEVHNLRMAMNEVFGEENFVAQLVWEGAGKNDVGQVGTSHEYVIVFARNRFELPESWTIAKEAVDPVLEEVDRLRKKYKKDYDAASVALAGWFRASKATPSFAHRRFRFIDKYGVYKEDDPTAPGGRHFDLINPRTKKVIPLRRNRGWAFDQDTFDKMVEQDRITFVTPKSIMVRRYLHETNRLTPQSVFYQPVRSASERLARLMDGNVFDYPKDETVLQKFVEMATDATNQGEVILDFFAGSASLADAVLRQNEADGGTRCFVAVQCAEAALDEEGKAVSGYSTIDQIAVERIKRVQAALAENMKGTLRDAADAKAASVSGVRVFHITESHYKRWAGTTDQDAAKYIETMALYTDPLLPGWKPEGLLWEVALKAGYPLHSTVETLKEIKGQTVYRVTDPDKGTSFLACFDNKIAKDLAARLKLTREDTFVVRDAALDDTLAANLALTCTLRTI